MRFKSVSANKQNVALANPCIGVLKDTPNMYTEMNTPDQKPVQKAQSSMESKNLDRIRTSVRGFASNEDCASRKKSPYDASKNSVIENAMYLPQASSACVGAVQF